MCGIAGFVDFKTSFVDNDLNRMTDSLEHRGPDARGVEFWNLEQCRIGFGHRRLSIIDRTDASSQPMSKLGMHICFNGEVYNYRELRLQLLRKGYEFKSAGDVEVVLTAIHCWGIKAVERFVGMFAIVIFDENEGKIYFLTDRAGIKPLYIYRKDDLLLFASELKAFHVVPKLGLAIDRDSVRSYFKFGRVPSPSCIFQNCRKVEPGSILVFDLITKGEKLEKYWNVFDYVSDKSISISDQDLLDSTEVILKDAFDLRMVADVPVGLFLSGGYDSSLVCAILQKDRTDRLRTFNIGFEFARYDESEDASRIAEFLGTDHQKDYCTTNEAQEIISDLAFIYDEPINDSSAIPTILVSRKAREHVSVVLSADGGDEQFVGYERYDNSIKMAQLITRLGKRRSTLLGDAFNSIPTKNVTYRKISRILQMGQVDQISSIQTSVLTDEDLNLLLIDCGGEIEWKDRENFVNGLFASEYQNYLHNDILTKVDRATMSVGLEGREPFLDHRIAEWSMSIPLSRKCPGKEKKFILKEIAHKHIPENLFGQGKRGFSVPINFWLRNELSYLLDEYITRSIIAEIGFLEWRYISSRLEQFQKNRDNTNFIWSLLVFIMWHQKWVARK